MVPDDVCGLCRGLTSARHLVTVVVLVMTGFVLFWTYLDHSNIQEYERRSPNTARYGGLRDVVHEALNDVLVNNVTTRPPWDYNWDKRAGRAVGGVTRSILLIRHGQYDLTSGELTDKGRQQANLTGARLKELNLSYTGLVHSTMTRAQQTANIIHDHLKQVTIEADDMLCEGGPVPPQPTITYWGLPEVTYYTDGPRVEGAFRKYFHRADQTETRDVNLILVGHGNIFRYFTLRALQLPREAWMRVFLPHGSVSVLHVYFDGTVGLTKFGDSGHFPPSLVTF